MECELYHYGILGMKWGIRRPVGSDGLVRKAGNAISKVKVRLKTPKENADAKSSNRVKMVSPEHKQRVQLKKKPVYEMSNDELSAYVKRTGLEQAYSKLRKNDISKGRVIVNRVMANVGSNTIDQLLARATKGTPMNKRAILESALYALLNKKK